MYWRRILLIALISIVFLAYFFLSYDDHEPRDSNQLELIEKMSLADLFSVNSNPAGADVGEYNPEPGNDIESDFRSTSENVNQPADSHPPMLERLEVFGIVVDENNLPIDDVLISDEISGNGTRSNADGQYRIFLQLPKFNNPLLNFLRTGYKGKRIGLSAEEFKNEPSVELNVTLIEATNTTSLHGWVGNDIGAGLPNLKIRLVSKGGLGIGTIFYVVHSDDKGDFSFEGIRSGLAYKLEVYPPPGYSSFSIHVLNITQNTPRLNIVLDQFNLVGLRGMVVNREGAPVPDFKMLLESVSTNFPVESISTDSSGFYSLDKFPTGEVKFSTLAPEYFRISGITLDRNQAQNLILVVDKGTYYLSGWVSDENGIPLENARVTLEASINMDETISYSYRSSYTDIAGGFSFADVGNKSHLITVYAEGLEKKETTHRFTSPSDNIHITVPPK
jgi:hypothetical protein